MFIGLILISAFFTILSYGHVAHAVDRPNFYQNGSALHYQIVDEGDKNINVEPWLTFFGILSTFFAIFFVYSGFKIENTKEKIEGMVRRVEEFEKKIQEEIYEYARQLEYCMSYIVQKQFDKAIDALTVLRNEYFVLKDSRKINTCCFFLAHCYYERGLSVVDSVKKKEDLALAVEYINQAISDPLHPLKMEIINAFTSLDSH